MCTYADSRCVPRLFALNLQYQSSAKLIMAAYYVSDISVIVISSKLKVLKLNHRFCVLMIKHLDKKIKKSTVPHFNFLSFAKLELSHLLHNVIFSFVSFI